MEQAEKQQSKFRSKIATTNQPKLPDFAGQQSQAPAQPPIIIPVTPLPECTPGELGLETGEKYDDDFSRELANLKEGISVAVKDPKISQFAEEIQRKEALNADALDQSFLRHLQNIAFTPANQQQPPTDNFSAPGQTAIPSPGAGANLATPSQPTNPFNVSIAPTVINQSGLGQNPLGDSRPAPRIADQQEQPFNPIHSTAGWGNPAQGAFDSMAPVIIAPYQLSPVTVSPQPAKAPIQQGVQQPATQDSVNSKAVFGIGSFVPSIPVPVPPTQTFKPKIADPDLIALLRRVGI